MIWKYDALSASRTRNPMKTRWLKAKVDAYDHEGADLMASKSRRNVLSKIRRIVAASIEPGAQSGMKHRNATRRPAA